MFHSTATGAFANVENKHVAFERRSVHQFQFILADAPQIFFHLFLAPVITVDHHPNLGFNSGQLKHFELPCLDGSVGEGIVIRRIATNSSSSAHRFSGLN